MTVDIIEDPVAAGYPDTCYLCYERDAVAVIICPESFIPVCRPCLQDLRDALVEDARGGRDS